MRQHARAVRAGATVDQRGRQGRIRGTVLLFAERPDRVRVDAMTQFGPASILTSDGSRFALTDLREGKFVLGQTCPENIARLMGLHMSASDVAMFLLGSTPTIAAEEQSIDCHEGLYRITLRAHDGARQELDLDVREGDRSAPVSMQHLRLARSELFDASGRTEWRATYGDYRVVADRESTEEPKRGIAMPFRVRFEDPRRNADTLVRFDSIDLNIVVPDAAFTQSPRPGMRIEEASCEEGS